MRRLAREHDDALERIERDFAEEHAALERRGADLCGVTFAIWSDLICV